MSNGSTTANPSAPRSTAFRDNVIRVLLLVGSVLYIWAIIRVGQISLKSPNEEIVKDEKGKEVLGSDGRPLTKPAKPPEIPGFLLGLVTAMGTALAVNTGRELGIPSQREGQESAPISIIWERLKEIISVIWNKLAIENIPRYATVLYLLGLLIALFFFVREGTSSASAELLQSSWTSLVGLLAGAWSIKTE